MAAEAKQKMRRETDAAKRVWQEECGVKSVVERGV